MAVTADVISKTMALRVVTGTDDTGANVLKTYSYSSIKPAATDDQLYATAEALAPLFAGAVEAVRKTVTEELTDSAL